MADPSPDLLKCVELRLLRCTLSQDSPPPRPPQTPTPQPPNSLHSHISTLLDSIERGDYAAVLSSPAAGLIFGFAASWEFENSVESAALFYGQVERIAEDFLRGGRSSEAWLRVLDSDGDDDSEPEIELRFSILMCLGVAALLAFTQQNVTGPIGNFPPFPLLFLRAKEDGASDGGEWDMWARRQLTSVGCDLVGKFSLLQYIVYAKILLSKTKDLSMEEAYSCLHGTRSISWWLCRLILLEQRILDELSSSLYDLLQVLNKETLLQFGELDNCIKYWGPMLRKGEASTIVSMAQLEAGIMEYKYGRVDSSRLHLNSAEEACGMHLSVTGVLGFRTIHQVEAKSQLVLVANTDHQINGGGRPEESPQGQTENSACEEKRTLHDCSDVLMTPKLVTVDDSGCNGNFMDVGKGTSLLATQQAVVLAQCLHLKRQSCDDELSRWEMAPYIEAVDAQHEAYYIIRSFCDILRIRWESTRSRTKQRALLMMEKLVEAVYEVLPLAAQRIQFSYGVHVPTIPALRKEYAELLVSCGMVGEALKIFEDLELWDNLIYCYSLLGKKAAAVDLIKARLCVMPNDPRLWCSLGDVTNTDTHYQKALEVSNDRSARAKRSLARSAYNRGDYLISKNLWESAMALNSLFPDGWFALGAAALKARDIDKALDGFTRAVQLDPENGEAWNNVACLHMVKKKSKPAFIAFKEALKFRRNSWQLWENYSHVALDVGSFGQALEATKKVLDLSSNKQVDVELLDKVMTAVEERSSMSANPSNFSEGHDICTSQIDSGHLLRNSPVDSGSSEHLIVEPRENELLLDMLGSILGQVVRSGDGDDIWGLYARWHKLKGNLIMCSEALLKQVRSYQGSDLWHDRDRFKKFARASLQLCNIYMEIASSTSSRRELTSAEMHLRNSVKQAVNFSNAEEYQDLQACLDEVKKRLNDTSSEGAQLK